MLEFFNQCSTTAFVRRNEKTQAILFANSGMDDGNLTVLQTPTPAILVAETEMTARSSLSELLRDEGYRVIEAANSATAINELARDPKINVVLADLEMPSWTSIIQHTRSQLPESFILGMLRYGALANALEAQRLGAHAYLIKPLNFPELHQWIQRCLTGGTHIKT